MGEPERAELMRAGLTAQRDSGGSYDRFRDRIVFPIHDRRGRPIGFGARVLGDDTPKYLNSPETPVFHKGPRALRTRLCAFRQATAIPSVRG